MRDLRAASGTETLGGHARNMFDRVYPPIPLDNRRMARMLLGARNRSTTHIIEGSLSLKRLPKHIMEGVFNNDSYDTSLAAQVLW